MIDSVGGSVRRTVDKRKIDAVVTWKIDAVVTWKIDAVVTWNWWIVNKRLKRVKLHIEMSRND